MGKANRLALHHKILKGSPLGRTKTPRHTETTYDYYPVHIYQRTFPALTRPITSPQTRQLANYLAQQASVLPR